MRAPRVSWTLLLGLGLCCLAPSALASEDQGDVDRILERSEWFLSRRRLPDGTVGSALRLKAAAELQAQREQMKADGTLGGAAWTSIGPNPTRSGTSIVSGRVVSLAVDPRDSNVVYAGTATGGVWKTIDAGGTWTALTDDQPALASGSIALDPLNPDIIYVGTGELSFSGDSYHGAGILKSEDAGATWRNIRGPFADIVEVRRGTAAIGSLAIHPTQTNIVLAGAYFRGPDNQYRSGVYRSVDGGDTWSATPVLPGAAAIDITFDISGVVAYASLGYYNGAPANGVYVSFDAGETWTAINGAPPAELPSGIAVGRLALALDPNDPAAQTLYAAAAPPNTSGALLGIFKTTDGGQTWNRISNQSLCDGQCWYDLAIRVHPSDPNVVMAGGAVPPLFISMNGGLSFVSASTRGGESIHVDLHVITFSVTDATPRLYVGCDGGIWRNDNILDTSSPHVDLNQTLAITQLYPGLSIHPTDPTIGFAGAQDNQTQKYTGSLLWEAVTCGDGGQTAVDYQSPNIVYATCQNIDVRKSIANGNPGTFGIARAGINSSDRVQFIPPLTIDPIEPQRLYFGTYRLYRTGDGAGLWSAISGDLSGGTNALTAISVAPSNADVLYTGAFSGRVYVTFNALSDAPTFDDITEGLPLRPVTALAVDETDPSVVYVTLAGYSGIDDQQGHVFQRDSGSWLDVSGDLPNIPTNDVVIDSARSGLYIATDVGVYALQSPDHWVPVGTGLPIVPVVGMKLHSSGILRVATHGRSVWDLSLN